MKEDSIDGIYDTLKTNGQDIPKVQVALAWQSMIYGQPEVI
jgi:hypothetical protein